MALPIYSRNDIRNIAFERINERFSKGKYLGVEVTIDMTNGYINGPHLVGQVKTSGGKPKEFFNWRKTTGASEIIEYLSTLTHGRVAPTDNTPGKTQQFTPIIDVTDAPNGLRGAYIHPRLVAHVAQWASPIFADKVALIINEYAITEMMREKNTEITELKRSIEEIKTQNQKLLDEMKAVREENSHVIGQLDVMTGELENTSAYNEELAVKVDTANATVEKIAAKLNIAVQQRVPPTVKPASNEVFAVYGNARAYYMIRRQKKTITTGINNAISNGYTQRLFYSDSPNAVNLGLRIKEKLPANLGTVSGVIIKLMPGKTSADLINFIRAAESEKLRV